MNENIKRLMREADYPAPEIAGRAQMFAKLIVGECVLAILATDTRSLVYTTYDRGVVNSVISKVVDSVRDHFKEKENV
jgi:carbamoylphosphate synthase small subunit